MRTRIMLAMWAGLLSTGAAMAQDTVILQPEVEVRSGPSKNFYPTSKLRQGDRVTVVGESKDPLWLEIKPPQGSFSWINARYLEKTSDARLWRVQTATSILPGSSLVDQAPNRESAKLAPGTIVVVMAHANTVGGETWLPIQTQPTEVRYIPVESVRPATAIAANVGSASWTRTPQDALYRDPVLAEAEKAFAAGDRNRAAQLYQQVANSAADPNSKVIAMNRLASLQQSPYGPVQGTTTSLSPSNTTPATPLNLQTLKAPEWSAYGRLRDIKLQREDGQPIYALEDAQGRVLTYVSTNPGKSLQIYIGRWVSVFGPTMYRPDTAARMPYVVASHVAVP